MYAIRSYYVNYEVLELPFLLEMPETFGIGTNDITLTDQSGTAYSVLLVLYDSEGTEKWSSSTNLLEYCEYTFEVPIDDAGDYTLELNAKAGTVKTYYSIEIIRITSYNVCYTKLLRFGTVIGQTSSQEPHPVHFSSDKYLGFFSIFTLKFPMYPFTSFTRITSYNVCYTKLLRTGSVTKIDEINGYKRFLVDGENSLCYVAVTNDTLVSGELADVSINSTVTYTS